MGTVWHLVGFLLRSVGASDFCAACLLRERLRYLRCKYARRSRRLQAAAEGTADGVASGAFLRKPCGKGMTSVCVPIFGFGVVRTIQVTMLPSTSARQARVKGTVSCRTVDCSRASAAKPVDIRLRMSACTDTASTQRSTRAYAHYRLSSRSKASATTSLRGFAPPSSRDRASQTASNISCTTSAHPEVSARARRACMMGPTARTIRHSVTAVLSAVSTKPTVTCTAQSTGWGSSIETSARQRMTHARR